MKKIIIFTITIFLLLPFLVNGDYELSLKYPKIFNIGPEGGILEYVRYLYFLGLAFIGAAALFALIYGGVMYITSDVITSKEEAKKWMLGAVTGLLLGFLSYLILFTINPDLVKWELNIPETPAGPQPSLPEEGSLICRSEQGYHYEWPLKGNCGTCKKGLKTENENCEEKGARMCEVPVPIKDKFCETPVCCYENTHLICDDQMCKRIEGAGENECVNEGQYCSDCNMPSKCTEEQCVGSCLPKEKWDNQLCKCVKNSKCFTSNECTEEECAPDGKCGGDFYWDASTCTCKYTPQEFTCQSEPGKKQRMCLDACTQRFPISVSNLVCPENQICCEESECQINGYYCYDSCPQGFAPITTYSCGTNYVCCEISNQ